MRMMLIIVKICDSNKETSRPEREEILMKKNKTTEEYPSVVLSDMARLPGFEPGAFRLGGGPSILLRYKRRFIMMAI